MMQRESVTRHSPFVKRCLPIWALLLVTLLASAAVWGPGIVNTRGGGDSPFLLQRTHQLAVNLRAGVFPVRWMPDAAYGLGYPFFNHYSALPFYVAALLNLTGIDLLTALKLTQTLGFVMAGLAMFGWVHHVWRNRAMAWLAAVAYTVAPFHLVNVYVRGDSLSEFYAFVWYPLILWAVVRLVRRGPETRLLDVFALALAYAGLIVTHNLSAAIFSPFALLYLFLLVWHTSGKRWRTLGLGLGALVLGFMLSAWVWMPALLETQYVQSETLTQGYFHYTNQFRSTNLVQSDLLFDYDIAPTLGGRTPFAMGGPQALMALLGLIVLSYLTLKQRQSPPAEDEAWTVEDEGQTAVRRSSNVLVVIGLLLSTFMVTSLSQFLWDYLPLLELVQFPWRFLSVQALFAAAAVGYLVLPFRGRRAWVLAGAASVLLMASAVLPLQPERLPIGPQDVTSTRLQEYELFTGNIGTTIRWEWLPEAAVPRPFTFDTVIEPDAAPRVIVLSGMAVDATQTLRSATEQIWSVHVGDSGAKLAFPLLYWPGWQAWVDGESTPAWAVEGSGYLTLAVSPGEHTVRMKLGRTRLRAGAELLSVVALLAVLGVGFWQVGRSGFRATYRKSESAAAQESESRVAQYAAVVVPGVLLVLVVLLLLHAQSSPPVDRQDDLTMDFVAMPYLHHNSEGVTFVKAGGAGGDADARLLSYTFSADQLVPGQALTVTVNWDSAPQSSDSRWANVRLVSPAEHLPDNGIPSYTLAEDPVPLAPFTVHRLVVPENTPRGLYLLQLSLEGPDTRFFALTPSGAGRGPLYLRPVRVTDGAPFAHATPVLAQVGSDILLHAAQVEQTPGISGPATLTVGLEWSSLRRLASNYKVSVRLLDSNGDLRVSTDTQPGYGFAPTSLWRPGERIGDRYVLLLPDDLPAGDGYRLTLVFYQAQTLAEVARVELETLALPLEAPVVFEPRPRLFELPTLSHPLDVVFSDPADSSGGDRIRLAGYDVMVEDESLDLQLWWLAQRQPRLDYTVFVHLLAPAAPADIVTQADAMPRRGSYPTSRWLAGEIVSDTVRLSLADVLPGAYRLAVGLYDATTGTRLAVVGSDEVPWPDGRLILSDEIVVIGD